MSAPAIADSTSSLRIHELWDQWCFECLGVSLLEDAIDYFPIHIPKEVQASVLKGCPQRHLEAYIIHFGWAEEGLDDFWMTVEDVEDHPKYPSEELTKFHLCGCSLASFH